MRRGRFVVGAAQWRQDENGCARRSGLPERKDELSKRLQGRGDEHEMAREDRCIGRTEPNGPTALGVQVPSRNGPSDTRKDAPMPDIVMVIDTVAAAAMWVGCWLAGPSPRPAWPHRHRTAGDGQKAHLFRSDAVGQAAALKHGGESALEDGLLGLRGQAPIEQGEHFMTARLRQERRLPVNVPDAPFG